MTGAAGLVGSHVARLLAERGDDLRIVVRRTTRPRQPVALGGTVVTADLLDRAAVRRACAESIASSTCRARRACAPPRQAVAGERARHAIVLEEALRAGVERVVHTSSVAAVGPAPHGSTADERQPFPAVGAIRSRTRAPSARPRSRPCGSPPAGCRSSSSTPPTSSAAGDVNRSSTELVRRFLRRELPAYVDGALNASMPRMSPAGTCSPTSAGPRASATSWATATSRSTASSPISGGCPGSSRRR